MNLPNLRQEAQEYPELFELFVEELLEEIVFVNPDIFIQTETEARSAGTFIDSVEEPVDFPDDVTASYVWNEIKLEISPNGNKRHKIRLKYDKKLRAIAAPYLASERDTWMLQKEALEAYDDSGGTIIKDYIQTMADAREIDVVLLLDKIRENRDLYYSKIFRTLGRQQKKLDGVV